MRTNKTWKHHLEIMPSALAETICGGMQRGIEKENIRIDSHGQYSRLPHPQSLGSALKHPMITTDFSESLLEMVTPACQSRKELFKQLVDINQWVTQQLAAQQEMLWPYSMPYLLAQNEIDAIPIADYGSSFVGQMKAIYRRGLVQRYGKAMQMIAGIHYNVSWPKELFQALQSMDTEKQSLSAQDYQSDRLMGLVRNFLRQQWLCPFLFGASPVCFSGSLLGHPASSNLQPIDQAGAWAGVTDTSLRLSDVGYHNPYQNCVRIDYQDVRHYAQSLLAATQRSMPAYEKLVLQDQQGQWQQLNTHVLQVENEFYTMIRPKSDQANQGRPAVNLCKHGVAYIELRGLDLDPTTPLGITPITSAFCDLWLTYLLLQESAPLTKQDQQQAKHDLNLAVYHGRAGESVEDQSIQTVLAERAQSILLDMQPLAEWMDQHDKDADGIYLKALQAQIEKTQQAAKLPSAKLMQAWQQSQLDFKNFMLAQAKEHRDFWLKQSLEDHQKDVFENMATQSLLAQQQLECSQSGTLDDYLQHQLS